jgi:hypothetical protein
MAVKIYRYQISARKGELSASRSSHYISQKIFLVSTGEKEVWSHSRA